MPKLLSLGPAMRLGLDTVETDAVYFWTSLDQIRPLSGIKSEVFYRQSPVRIYIGFCTRRLLEVCYVIAGGYLYDHERAT